MNVESHDVHTWYHNVFGSFSAETYDAFKEIVLNRYFFFIGQFQRMRQFVDGNVVFLTFLCKIFINKSGGVYHGIR